MSRIYEGDVGTKIRLNAGSSISGATTKKIKYKKPDGTKGEWPAEIEDTQYAYYITLAGDLDLVGKWEVQLYVVLPSWTGHGEIASFEVHSALT